MSEFRLPRWSIPADERAQQIAALASGSCLRSFPLHSHHRLNGLENLGKRPHQQPKPCSSRSGRQVRKFPGFRSLQALGWRPRRSFIIGVPAFTNSGSGGVVVVGLMRKVWIARSDHLPDQRDEFGHGFATVQGLR
jgi:hypothetical protein